MARAIDLARMGAGRVSPNPMVGAVLAAGGRILAEGAHQRFGGPHAERDLLHRWGGRAIPPEAVLYLTLEPCVHPGKTPPCLPALLATPIRRYEIARLDPHPRVCGRGVGMLRAAGRRVRVGLMQAEAASMNAPYETAHRFRRARVNLKIAATLDGKVADDWGRARWITGEPSRRLVRRWRASADALVVGAGTVLADDPRMRAAGSRGPGHSRIVLDSGLRIDPDCLLARTWRAERRNAARGDGPTALETVRVGNWLGATSTRSSRSGLKTRWTGSPRLIVATVDPPASRAARFQRRGWEVWRLPTRGSRVHLRALARRARREGLLDLLVEPGPELAASFLAHGPVDRLLLFTAPRILGGGRGWTDRLPPLSLRRRIEALPADPPVQVGGDLLWDLRGRRGGPLIP